MNQGEEVDIPRRLESLMGTHRCLYFIILVDYQMGIKLEGKTTHSHKHSTLIISCSRLQCNQGEDGR